ncbi:type II toxin-antitoxin system VapC family toxin [Endozoicomonas sp.]|uniref:type II toxin-antitoxin system VapC family toxin n=1 Tax=Endozoicomonas sp. TaxID=1892382 RepID=UPI0028886823|nr:type II toxin-antitoxin system VapC family toxin [Endozoicomonas sp.]
MIVLDTCAFIWDALSHKKLTNNAKRQIIQAEQKQQLMICDITLWEVAMLVSKGRFTIGVSASTFCQLAIQARNIEVLPITPDIAERSVSFDHTINNDPADRLIAATTIIHDAALVTADHNLRESPLLKTIW